MVAVQIDKHDSRVGDNIRQLRLMSRMSQIELAFLLGKYMHIQPTDTQVSFHENGRRHVNGTYLQAYAQIFKIPARLLYTKSYDDPEFQEAIRRWYTDNGCKQP